MLQHAIEARTVMSADWSLFPKSFIVYSSKVGYAISDKHAHVFAISDSQDRVDLPTAGDRRNAHTDIMMHAFTAASGAKIHISERCQIAPQRVHVYR